MNKHVMERYNHLKYIDLEKKVILTDQAFYNMQKEQLFN